jgi:HSP20 family molecular chaperone IbpA
MSNLITYDAMFNLYTWPTHSSLSDEVTVEKDGSYKLTVDVPGCNREHVSLSAKGSQLTITLSRPNKNKKTITYRIGSKVDAAAISATCKDGVLTVTCPVKPSEQPRDIPVN